MHHFRFSEEEKTRIFKTCFCALNVCSEGVTCRYGSGIVSTEHWLCASNDVEAGRDPPFLQKKVNTEHDDE